jgi:hypothetical protein
MCVKELEQFLNIGALELVFEVECYGLTKCDFLPCAVCTFVVTLVFIDVLEEH